MACNNLLNNLDFNDEFRIHTDVSDLKLGAVIIQKGKPIALYSRKRTEYQKRSTVIEKQMLITIENLKEYSYA